MLHLHSALYYYCTRHHASDKDGLCVPRARICLRTATIRAMPQDSTLVIPPHPPKCLVSLGLGLRIGKPKALAKALALCLAALAKLFGPLV